MNKKNKVYILLCICISMMAALSAGGCQLAKNEESEGGIFADDFIGVYVTLNPINDVNVGLFETESTDNEKIYATKVEVKSKDSDYTTWEYEFEDFEGIPMYDVYMSDDGGPGYYSFKANECVFDAHQAVTCEDEAAYKNLTGNVYLSEGGIVYLNPVYQEADGDIYMVAADMGDEISEYAKSKLYRSSKNSIKGGTTVEMSFEIKGEVEKVSFIAMSSENEIVWSDTYIQSEVPQEITIPDNTEYLIVRTTFEGEKEPEIKLLTSSESFIKLLKKGKGVVLEAQKVELKWE